MVKQIIIGTTTCQLKGFKRVNNMVRKSGWTKQPVDEKTGTRHRIVLETGSLTYYSSINNKQAPATKKTGNLGNKQKG